MKRFLVGAGALWVSAQGAIAGDAPIAVMSGDGNGDGALIFGLVALAILGLAVAVNGGIGGDDDDQ